MKVTVLGGSAAGGNKGAGCAGFLFHDGNTSLVIDLGPGTLLELRKHVDDRARSAILLSHYRLLHILALGPLNYLLRYTPAGPADTLDVWIPPGTPERFACSSGCFGNGGERCSLAKPFKVQE